MAKRILKDLGDGLILRRASRADTEALATFHGSVHVRGGWNPTEPNEWIQTWTRELMSGQHPIVKAKDFTVVEDTNNGAVVSSLNLIDQTWTYDDVPVPVGRPELVSTHPAYRRRGLIREQFDLVHRWSARRGHKMTAVTGIPWFYRMFGYEMGLELAGRRTGFVCDVPKLEDGKTEPYRLREADEKDLPFIAKVYANGTKRYLVTCVRDEVFWRYCLFVRHPNFRPKAALLRTPSGKNVGALVLRSNLAGPALDVLVCELAPRVSWSAAAPSVLRYLKKIGDARAEESKETGKEVQFGAIGFALGTQHPVYEAARTFLCKTDPPYAFYVRVPNLPDFLRHIAPALERRLANSALAGHTGELKISFYRTGLRVTFEKGRLTAARSWTPTVADNGHAAFPDLTFLQLLFGYRSLAEINYAFADAYAQDHARMLLNVLFPKRPSLVWPID